MMPLKVTLGTVMLVLFVIVRDPFAKSKLPVNAKLFPVPPVLRVRLAASDTALGITTSARPVTLPATRMLRAPLHRR